MRIETDFVPGAIGTVAALHGLHYAKHWGFGTFFEAKVSGELSEFAMRRQDDDLILFAIDGAGVAASLFLDLHDPHSNERGAHLRWFIAADRCHGKGIGRQFMGRAIEHAERHSAGRAWLTTFAGLEPAKHLYESFGFTLSHEAEGEVWGTLVREQEFRRIR